MGLPQIALQRLLAGKRILELDDESRRFRRRRRALDRALSAMERLSEAADTMTRLLDELLKT